jgi:lipopolysaccharide export system protein LptC
MANYFPSSNTRAPASIRLRPSTGSGYVRWVGAILAFTAFSMFAQEIGNAPVKNFVLPLFSKEGPRTVTLRGSAASRPSEKQIDIVDLNLTRFSGDANQRIDDILLAPSASFFPEQHLAKGDQAVRLIRDDMEINGEVWTYNHARQKVTIDKNVRVVLHAQLKEVLK